MPRKIILALIIALFLPTAAMADEIVEITSDDIILVEPNFSDFVKEKMPFYEKKLLNLEKERPIKRLKVEFNNFDEFWEIIDDYYAQIKIQKDNILEFEKEALSVREEIFKESSLKSSSAIKLIISFRYLKKNIQYAKDVLESHGKDVKILFSILKTSDIRAEVGEVADLKTFTGTMVNALQDLKAGNIDFDEFEKINSTKAFGIKNAGDLNKQFLDLGIEITGAFHVGSEMDKTVKGLAGIWEKLYNYELYVIENKKVTIANFSKTALTIIVLLLIYYLLTITINKSVNDKSRAYAINTLSKYAFNIAILIVFLTGIGLDLSKITLLVSALSVGIGFGLSTFVSNFISGIMLLLEGSVRVDDILKLEDGSIVTVEKIGLRKSILYTKDRLDIIVPNVNLVSQNVINLTYMKKPITRNRITFSVNPAVDFKKLEKVAVDSAIKTLGGRDKVLRHDPILLVHTLETNAIHCELLVSVDNLNNYIPDSQFKKNLLEDFQKNKLDIFLAPVSMVEIINQKN